MAIIEPEFMALTEGLDTASFWAENECCGSFTLDKPRASLSFSPDDHWIFGFLNVPSTLRYYRDKAYRDALHQEVNAVTEEYVGRTFFDEDTWEYEPKRIENLFGCAFSYRESSTPWLTPATDKPDEFAGILDEAEATDLATWSFPEAFLAEWEARKEAGKPLPKLGTGSRGPATIMTSVLQPQTVFFWMMDHPDADAPLPRPIGHEDGRVQPAASRIQRQHGAGLVDHRRQQRTLQPAPLPRVLRPRAREGARGHGAG